MRVTPSIPDSRARASTCGFTLIELIVVVLILSVVMGMTASIMLKPIQAYGDVRRRAALTDTAEAATRRMGRDIRSALPNSLRVAGGGLALELLHVLDGARYRAEAGVNPTTVDHTPATHWLDFTEQEDSFNILGRFQELGLAYGVGSPAGYRLAIYPTEAAIYVDAAAGSDPGVITSGAAGGFQLVDETDEDRILLNPGFELQFRLASPRQRVYVVDAPVSYVCDLGTEQLVRYSGYAIASAQPTDGSVVPLSAGNIDLLATNVTGCDFRYNTSTATHSGLVTIDLTVGQDGESARLLHQIHVSNAP